MNSRRVHSENSAMHVYTTIHTVIIITNMNCYRFTHNKNDKISFRSQTVETFTLPIISHFSENGPANWGSVCAIQNGRKFVVN